AALTRSCSLLRQDFRQPSDVAAMQAERIAMKRQIVGLCVGLGASFAAQALFAQDEVSCADHDTLIAHLGEDFGEARQIAGLSSGGQLIEIFGSEETGTWTVVVTDPGGTACFLVTGDFFKRYDGAETTAKRGEAM
ncbi:MAG: hypothetical protein P8X66_07605, partial [Maritimibacter sp.]